MLSKTARKLIVPIGMTLAVSLALSACGRKGDIDPPSTPVEMRNKRNADGTETKPATAERPFILDKLALRPGYPRLYGACRHAGI